MFGPAWERRITAYDMVEPDEPCEMFDDTRNPRRIWRFPREGEGWGCNVR